MTRYLRCVAVVIVATHKTKHIRCCNSSVRERSGIRRLMEAG